MLLPSAIDRMRVPNSMPSIPGMLMSRSARSNFSPDRKRSNAAAASDASNVLSRHRRS